MHEDILKSQWNQIRGQLKVWWSVLTEEDLNKINGRRDQLISILQQKYGFNQDEATRELDDHLAQLKMTPTMTR